MILRDTDRIFLSRPQHVAWAGWETDTLRLQQHGWQLTAEQNVMDQRLRLYLKHPDFNIYGLSEVMQYDFYRIQMRGTEDRPVTFHVYRMFTDMIFSAIKDLDLKSIMSIDAQPQVIERRNFKSLDEQFHLFAPALTRTEELIVDPKTVSGLLEEIRKLQEPELAAIRERNRTRDYIGSTYSGNPVERQVVHAQIISLAA